MLNFKKLADPIKTSNLPFNSFFKKWDWLFGILDQFYDLKNVQKKLILLGGRWDGKTYGAILHAWVRAYQNPNIKYDFVFFRISSKSNHDTWKTIKLLAPDSFWNKLKSKKAKKEKSTFLREGGKSDAKILKFKNVTMQCVPLTGIQNPKSSWTPQMLGFELGICDERTLFFEEAFEIPENIIGAGGMVSRNSKITRLIIILNDFDDSKSYIKLLNENSEYDPAAFGKYQILAPTKKYYNSKFLKNIPGYQFFEIQNYWFLKLNHVALFKAGLMKMFEVQLLWESAEKSPATADTILFAKTGSKKAGVYAPFLISPLRINFWDFYQKWNFDNNIKIGSLLFGIDSATSHDKTVVICALLTKNEDHLYLIDTRIIKPKKIRKELIAQFDSITSFIAAKINDFEFYESEIFLGINLLKSGHQSILQKLQQASVLQKLNHILFNQNLSLNERDDYLTAMLRDRKITFLNTKGNEYLISEWRKISFKRNTKLARLGEDDCVEAFENALFPVWKRIKRLLFAAKSN